MSFPILFCLFIAIFAIITLVIHGNRKNYIHSTDGIYYRTPSATCFNGKKDSKENSIVIGSLRRIH